MEAVILKSGKAVKKSNLSAFVFDIYGFLSSFKDYNQKQFIYLTEANLSKAGEKAEAGYYYLEEYNLYMNNRGSYKIDKLIKNHKYKDFINAEVNDSIQLEIFSTASISDFYHYNEYNFKHLEKNRNYLLITNSQTTIINPTYIGTGNPKTKLLSNVAKSFFLNQMSLFDSVPVNQKNQYLEYVVRCALRINSINRDIFPILLSAINQSSSEEALLIETLKNSLNSKWEREIVIRNNSSKLLDDIINYYNSLINFYLDCFNNQKYLKDSESIVKLQYFINALDVDLLSTINPHYKIKLLKLFTYGYNDKNENLDASRLSKAIVKISDSFKENQSSEIDIFLDGLLDQKNGIQFNETIIVNKAPVFLGYEGESHKRTQITLFELVYNKLKANFFVELWQHSPLYYKINSSLNLDAKTSALSAFVTKVYTLWTHSKYNPNRDNIFNPNSMGFDVENLNNKTFTYTTKPASTFVFTSEENGNGKILPQKINRNRAPLIINLETYFINSLGHFRDTILTNFIDFNKILIQTNDFRNANIVGVPNPWANIELRNTSAYFAYGYYHIYQPVQVIAQESDFWDQFTTTVHSWSDGSETIHQTYLPAFLFHYMQEKEDTDFIYGLLWTTIKAAYKAVPEFVVFKKMIEGLLKMSFGTLETLETVISEDAYNIINDYANSCSLEIGDHEFCNKINELSGWLNNYRVAENQIVPNQIKNVALDIVFYVEQMGWPSDFDEEGGKGRELIINLAGEGTDCADVKEAVIEKVKAAKGYSINADGTNEPLFSDADYDEICNYIANLDLSDDFSFNSQKDIQVAFIFNAHRIEKQAKVSEVKERIGYWINIKKPINLGGRDKISYIFGENLLEAQNNYSLFKERMHELFGKYDLLKYQDKRIGGSALYKNPPGDIDTYLFVSYSEIKKLIDEYIQTWLQLAGETNNRRKRERYEEYGQSIEPTYQLRKIIYGNLIIKYKPENLENEKFIRLKDDKVDPYFTSSLINFSGPKKEVFDITIKDSSEDSQGTPPYIILNL